LRKYLLFTPNKVPNNNKKQQQNRIAKQNIAGFARLEGAKYIHDHRTVTKKHVVFLGFWKKGRIVATCTPNAIGVRNSEKSQSTKKQTKSLSKRENMHGLA